MEGTLFLLDKRPKWPEAQGQEHCNSSNRPRFQDDQCLPCVINLMKPKTGLLQKKSAERSPWTLKPWICSYMFREQKFSYIPSPPVSGCTFSPVICWKPLKTFRDHRRRWGALLQDSKGDVPKVSNCQPQGADFRIQQDPHESSVGFMSRKRKVGRFSRWKSWILHGC